MRKPSLGSGSRERQTIPFHPLWHLLRTWWANLRSRVRSFHYWIKPVVAISAFACLLLDAVPARAHQGHVTVVSAASLDADAPVAPHSIAYLSGEFDERTTKAPEGVPQTELASYTALIEGADGIERAASIFAVEPRRLVILIPDLPDGTAHLSVKRHGLEISDGEFAVRAVSPGLFSAAGSGGGLADARTLRVSLLDGAVTTEGVSFFNPNRGAYEPVPLNPAAEGSELYLVLRGTGIGRASTVAASIGGVTVPASIQASGEPSPGVDEVQVGPLPLSLAQRQLVDINMSADGIRANTVQVAFSPSSGEAVTFSNQIARVFQGECQTCHRPGQVAPFSLLDYESAKPWAHAIKSAVESGYMPPWKPVAGHGEFVGERRLSADEIDLIARWVDAGAPEGEPADLPEPLVFNPDWALGEPDFIIETPVFAPDPSGGDEYRCFSIPIPPEVTELRNIVGIEVQPGNRKIVHHLILYGDPHSESVQLEAASTDGRPGYECFGSARIPIRGFNFAVDSYLFGGWAPGATPAVAPEGSGFLVRPGSHIAVQLHYHSDGTEQSDSTRIGLHFSDEPTEDNLLVLAAINTDFLIPAGADRHEVTASFGLDSILGSRPDPALRAFLIASGIFPADIISVLPHMHLLGKEIRMEKVSPSGERTPMVYIDNWDFDWQDFYNYVEPVRFNAEDRLEVVAIYDNSTANPWNPNNPPLPVGWGERTTDEMCLVFSVFRVPSLCTLGFCGE